MCGSLTFATLRLMFIVGCDFGLVKSGIVVLDEHFNIQTQTLIRVQSSGAQRLVDIEQGFAQIVAPYTGELTAFIEGYAYGARYQRESLAELGGVMRRFFCINSIDYWTIPPTSNKYYVTGTGRASKNYMKKVTKEQWGIAFKSDDICDAYGLAHLGVASQRTAKKDKKLELTVEQIKIIDEILFNKDHYLNGNTAKRRKNHGRETKTKSKR